MVYIDHMFGNFRKFIHEFKIESSSKDRVTCHERHTLLLQRSCQKDVFPGIVDGNDDVGFHRADAQGDIVEVPGRVGVFDHILDLPAGVFQPSGKQPCRSRSKLRFFMHDDRAVCR